MLVTLNHIGYFYCVLMKLIKFSPKRGEIFSAIKEELAPGSSAHHSCENHGHHKIRVNLVCTQAQLLQNLSLVSILKQ